MKASTTPRCGAKTRKGTPCLQPAGFRTDHVGHGPCKMHGGLLPGPRKAAAASEARAFAVAHLGEEVSGDPWVVILEAVRLARGVTRWYQGKLYAVDSPATEIVQGYERAIERQARVSEQAIKAGVAEREVRVAERLADTVVAAAEGALAALEAELGRSLSVGERTAFAGAFGGALSRLEGGTIDAAARDV